jgi:hypothetical protein
MENVVAFGGQCGDAIYEGLFRRLQKNCNFEGTL